VYGNLRSSLFARKRTRECTVAAWLGVELLEPAKRRGRVRDPVPPSEGPYRCSSSVSVYLVAPPRSFSRSKIGYGTGTLVLKVLTETVVVLQMGAGADLSGHSGRVVGRRALGALDRREVCLEALDLAAHVVVSVDRPVERRPRLHRESSLLTTYWSESTLSS